MRLQSLSEPRTSFPSRGFHAPAPTPLRHAPFILSPVHLSRCVVGNSPHKAVANNLAKLATSPIAARTLPGSDILFSEEEGSYGRGEARIRKGIF